jgi:hypothetical protein
VQKFERLDMEFLNQSNIYQIHLDKMKKSGKDEEEKTEADTDDSRPSIDKKSSKSSSNLSQIMKYITDSIEAFID